MDIQLRIGASRHNFRDWIRQEKEMLFALQVYNKRT